MVSSSSLSTLPTPADVLLEQLAEDRQEILADILERHPDIARARLAARSAALRAPQVRALPDPVAALNLFLLPPETRVGPQRLTLSISQKLPWFGKLKLRERSALYAAAALRAQIETLRLQILTEARVELEELAFLDRHEAILWEEKEHLVRHEEAARARYTAGVGLQQAVIKIQAEITRADRRLIRLEARRQSLLAVVNALRDQPSGTPLITISPPSTPTPLRLELDNLRTTARKNKPELHHALAQRAQRRAEVGLAGKDFRPDFKLGLGYTLVDGRTDEPGRINPPPGDGDDILAFSTAINLPIHRGRLEAALQETLEMDRVAEDGERRAWATIEGDLGKHAARLPLLFDEWRLLDGVLLAQAEEALSSAEAAYAAGKLGALELLDAEHVLFEVRTAAIRIHTEYAIASARLESAIAAPLASEESDHDD
jgi:outer membrane protein TolC